MLSEEQYQKKLKDVLKVVKAFLEGKTTIKEISEETGISKSSVQRYLNDEETLKELFGKAQEQLSKDIKEALEKNKKDGLSKGGKNFAKNNIPTKDEKGHFTGSIKK